MSVGVARFELILASERGHVMISALVLLLATGPVQDMDEVTKSCEKLFGPRIPGPELFDVNRYYVLRVDRDAAGQVAVAVIEPKYFYDDTHPDWKEEEGFEYLSSQQFDDLVERLEKLRPKGRFLRRNDSIIVTNLTCWRKAEHENAVLAWGELCDIRRGDSAPKLVRWIRVTYGKPDPQN